MEETNLVEQDFYECKLETRIAQHRLHEAISLNCIPRMAVIITPKYSLDHIFFLDYNLMLSDLSKHYSIFLCGNAFSAPHYAKSFVPLNPSVVSSCVSTFLYNKYMHSLSNKSWLFDNIRLLLEHNNDKQIASKLIQFLLKHKPGVAYLFPWFPESYPFIIREKCNSKIVVEFWEDQIALLYNVLKHNRVSSKTASQEQARGYKWLKRIVDSADHVIVPTETLKKRLVGLGLSNNKVSIVPVCQSQFNIQDPDYVRRRHGLRNEKILFYLGSLTGYHDLKTLFLALNKMKSDDVTLLIAGGTESVANKYKSLLRKKGIHVVYVGRPNPIELEYYISAADLCLAIYKFAEPSGFFPGTVIKYMLAGKPMVATDLPEIREMFKGSKAGVLIAQSDSEKLALVMDYLLKNPEEGAMMGATARRIAENNYLWQHHTKALLDVLFSKLQ